MLNCKDLVKKYNDNTVLNDVSVDVKENKLICYIGANGAGKSTLLSILTRTLKQDSGFVYLDNLEVLKWNQEELAKNISILRQQNNLNVRLTVYDLVSFGRYPYSKNRLKKEDIKKIDEALNYLDIYEFKDRFLDTLSGGQRQLAYIAMVLAQDTKYIFLDEPLNNLDMHHAKKIMNTLRKLVDELNKTVIVVIHDINFASFYADYIVALKNGKIIKEGNTSDVIQKEILKEIYNLDIDVIDYQGKKLCVYF